MAIDRMYLRMIDRAIMEFAKRMTRAEQREHAEMVQEEAGLWLFSNSEEERSYLWVCREAGIEDPEFLRERAMHLRRKFETRYQRRKK